MIVLLILLICVGLPCLTVGTIAAVVIYTRLDGRPSQTVRAAEDAVQVARLQTQRDLEHWKQQWILDQREEGQRPALPPGTQTVIPKDR